MRSKKYYAISAQAFDLSIDHKPELEIERDRITQAGGFIYGGRVNGSLNLARAIGLSYICLFKFD